MSKLAVSAAFGRLQFAVAVNILMTAVTRTGEVFCQPGVCCLLRLDRGLALRQRQRIQRVTSMIRRGRNPGWMRRPQ